MFLLILYIYFVSFLDKPEKTAPQLSERAVEQRAKWHIETDEMDYPVSPMYMDSLRQMGVIIHHKSRWFNGVTCEMRSDLAQKVADLGFVTDVEMTRDNSAPIYSPRKRRMPGDGHPIQPPLETDEQLALYNLRPLHNAGFEGQGILMAICDGGFQNVNRMSCFREEQELGHFDFTDDTDGFYGSTGSHGTMCLSTISGIMEDYHGAAVKADYYLMRSEESEHESPKEMDNLVAALETADSLGVNVFSVSLGYAYFDNDDWSLRYADLDGQTTRSSLAATIAARKGMLVCAAAGNEGDSQWHFIDSPADADSILTVGAVDVNGNMSAFSSWGPSADGRVKPEVCAVGVQAAVISPQGYVTHANGTSFATPLLAGMAASLWSALPDENAMQIRERIIRSANHYTSPNNHRGYGIPNAWKAYTMSPSDVESIQPSAVSSQKILRNGQIVIVRDNKAYTILGLEIGE